MNKSDAHSHHHITPMRIYLGVGAALIFLTAVTVTVAQIDLGGWNAIIALLIASIKALLVAFIFMHLLYDKKIYLVIFSIAIVFLTIFIALTMFDIINRGDINKIAAEPIEKEAAMYKTLKVDSTATKLNHSQPEDSGH